jgi:hypothetical protein
MSVDIGESLMQSWLRHVKRCDVVQTNWKAATHLGLNKNKAETLLLKIRNEYPTFCSGQDAGQILRQVEIDAMGCVVGKKKYFACDIAFHESGLHYAKGIDKVLSKMLRTIMCLYSVLEAKDAEIIFATPKFQTASDRHTLEKIVDELNDCLQNKWGLNEFCVKLYAEYEFETCILNAVMYCVPQIKDTSEVFVRACQIINVTQETSKKIGPSTKSTSAIRIKTTAGVIDVSELGSQDLIEQFVLPKLSNMSNRELRPYFDKTESIKMFGGGYQFLSPVMITTPVKGKSKDRCYKEAYYLEKTKQDVYVSNDCIPKKIIQWINDNLS